LADIAAVQRHVHRQYNLTSTNQWIAFGASFSGILSIFYRQKYSNLVTASVSSSAPIKMPFDGKAFTSLFDRNILLSGWEYFSNIGTQILNTTMGGSEECYNAVVNASSEVDRLIDTHHYDTLRSDFNLCEDSVDLKDAQNRFSVGLAITGVLGVCVQTAY
jgi:hypothetical protein